jgi:hypothetical protein
MQLCILSPQSEFLMQEGNTLSTIMSSLRLGSVYIFQHVLGSLSHQIVLHSTRLPGDLICVNQFPRWGIVVGNSV